MHKSPRTSSPPDLDRESPEHLHRPLLLAPCYSERPWGGRRLQEVLGKSGLPAGLVGESWEVSDHSHGLSSMAEEPYLGMTFGAVVRRHAREMLGRAKAPDQYPLLVKFLDATETLSVQVHPDDDWCVRARHEDRGKSECWYILDCEPGAEVILGTNPGATAADLRRAVGDGSIKSLLSRVPIRPGAFVTVPPRTIHAITAGTLLCEIQQVSDTTFRLWDWNRKPARALHLDQALEVADLDRAIPPIQFLPEEIEPHGFVERSVLNNAYFRVRALDVPPNCDATIRMPSGKRTGWVVCGVLGEGKWRSGATISRGSTWFLPACIADPLDIHAGKSGLRLLMVESLEI